MKKGNRGSKIIIRICRNFLFGFLVYKILVRFTALVLPLVLALYYDHILTISIQLLVSRTRTVCPPQGSYCLRYDPCTTKLDQSFPLRLALKYSPDIDSAVHIATLSSHPQINCAEYIAQDSSGTRISSQDGRPAEACDLTCSGCDLQTWPQGFSLVGLRVRDLRRRTRNVSKNQYLQSQ